MIDLSADKKSEALVDMFLASSSIASNALSHSFTSVENFSRSISSIDLLLASFVACEIVFNITSQDVLISSQNCFDSLKKTVGFAEGGKLAQPAAASTKILYSTHRI